jgi:hypothetical protein
MMAKSTGKPIIASVGGRNATLDDLKRFVAAPFFIPWYHSPESKQTFPLFLNEIGDINANRTFIPGVIERNPFFDHTQIIYFVADAGGKPIGRIAAFVDSRYNQEQREKYGEEKAAGWIGMFECIEDKYLAEQLFDAARHYLKGMGCSLVIGPAKFNANGPVGLLVKGFEHEPYFMEPYNAPYYEELFKANGFEKLDDWFSVRVDDASMEKVRDYIKNAKRLEEILKRSETRGKVLREATIRQADFSNIEAEVAVLDKEYNGNWGKGNHPQFVTMTTPEVRKLANDVKLVTRPEYVLIVERDGKPIGISASAPNINEKISGWDKRHPGYVPSLRFLSPRDLSRDISIFRDILRGVKDNDFESLRVLILGVDEKYRGTGLDGKLYSTGFEIAMNNGIRRASLSQLAERNTEIVIPLTKMGDNCITCRVYSSQL